MPLCIFGKMAIYGLMVQLNSTKYLVILFLFIRSSGLGLMNLYLSPQPKTRLKIYLKNKI